MTFEDEDIGFWAQKPVQLLAETAGAMHRDRRQFLSQAGPHEVTTTRRAVGYIFLSGNGVEVGAGDRPWPLPPDASCFYGDIRDGDRLISYFKNEAVLSDRILDAQTFEGIPDSTFDFVISAHVIEHLEDPLGAVQATIRVLKVGGVAVMSVPDMRHTFDCDRPPVTLPHLLQDMLDGGSGSRLQAYREHVRYVHPLLTVDGRPIPVDDEEFHASRLSESGMDVHFHAWTGDSFKEHLLAISQGSFEIECHVPVRNENIFVLRKV